MIGDTIVALATASGAGERAVVRLSGPHAFAAAARVFAPALARERGQCDGVVRVREAALPAMALTMVGPGSFTGEDVVELHVPGSPMLVQLLIRELLRDGQHTGVRAAQPGEFTARACQHGRLGPAQAEGLLWLLHAADQREAAAAMQWLRGGCAEAVRSVRGELQDRLALLEAGLDFEDLDTGAVPAAEWSEPLRSLDQRLDRLLAEMPRAAPGGELLLLGRSNAGKSTLANALAGDPVAIVADAAGTTRDLLRIDIGDGVHLWDAPGDLDDPGAADQAALALRERLSGRAAGLLVVVDATDPRISPMAWRSPLPWLAIVITRCDLVAAVPPIDEAARSRLPAEDAVFATSATTGAGLPELRTALLRAGRGNTVDAAGPLRSALQASRDAVRRAVEAAAFAPELAAVELQGALRALDGIDGSHDPEQLLDRIYGRFCLGK